MVKLAQLVLTNEDIAPPVAEALTELDAKEAVPTLKMWLATRNATVRHSAAAALTKLTGAKVVAPEVALHEPDPMPDTGSGLLITTERGDIEIELWNDEHPRTSGNLWLLARRGYFDDRPSTASCPTSSRRAATPAATARAAPAT